jgi:hypothetical protein
MARLRVNRADQSTQCLGIPAQVVAEIFDLSLTTLRTRHIRKAEHLSRNDADMYSASTIRDYITALIKKAEYRGRQQAIKEMREAKRESKP